MARPKKQIELSEIVTKISTILESGKSAKITCSTNQANTLIQRLQIVEKALEKAIERDLENHKAELRKQIEAKERELEALRDELAQA